jgi:hypothetical protein
MAAGKASCGQFLRFAIADAQIAAFRFAWRRFRHCERSEAIQRRDVALDSLVASLLARTAWRAAGFPLLAGLPRRAVAGNPSGRHPP